eukprot:scaffold51141_cov39-Tisochrysis_lutea.AAC.1
MPRMLMLKETNRAFIMRCVEAYACAIVLVTIMLGIYINKGSIVLAVYRSVTVAVIGTETLGYAWALGSLVKANEQLGHTRIYYQSSIVARVFIIVALIMRFTGEGL